MKKNIQNSINIDSIEDRFHEYRMMVNSSKDYITLIDANYIYKEVNTAYVEAKNQKREDVVGYSLIEIWGEDIFKNAIKDNVDRCLKGEVINFQSAFEFKESEVNYMDVTYYPCYGRAGDITHVVVVSHNITEIKKGEEKIKYLAYHDSLTDLPNRLQFEDRLTIEIAHAKRYKHMVAIFFMDLDDFKKVNDSLGHHAGDQLLQIVANSLKKTLRQSDTVSRIGNKFKDNGGNICRLGGDEFTIILPGMTDCKQASMISRRILQDFNEPVSIDGQEIYITASIGISVFPNDGEDSETIIKNADTAMYRAKEQGKNKYMFYSPSMSESTMKLIEMEKTLHHALDKNEFVLYYQPIYDLKNGSLIACEALVRLRSADNGFVLPEKFIPLAEETGLILPIGEWILKTACEKCKEWTSNGYDNLKVSINLSVRQIQDKYLLSKILKILKESRVDVNSVILEITESSMIENIDGTIKLLKKLRAEGIGLALDDFGTGYSSLTYLIQLPIDTLKIDRSFVRNMTSGSDTETIVAAIISMAKQLNLKIIAEGVETEEQLSFLKKHGCDKFQGYLYSPPVSEDEFFKLLERDYKK